MNRIINFFKNLFSINTNNIQLEIKTIKTIDILDDVWIIIDNKLIKGWVFNKTKSSIMVSSNNNDIDLIFHYKRPLTDTKIKNGNKILFLNELEANTYFNNE